jgi:Tfp pilus assembly protein PilF
MRRLVWPWPAPVFHAQVPPIAPVDALGALLFLGLVVAACASSRSGRAAALFTGASLLPLLAPALTRVSLSPVADRYLYMPSLGACWMAGAVVARLFAAPAALRRAPRLLAAVLAVWTVASAWTSYRAVASYRDDAAYWSAALARSPSDPFLLMKDGQYLADAGRFTEAEAELRRALMLGEATLGRSTRTVILDNLGDIALRQGHLDEARSWLDRAVALGPGYGLAHVHLGRWHRTKQLAAARDPSESARALAAEESRLAIASLDKAIQLDPTNTEALLMRADLAIDLGDKPAAIAAIRAALRYMPTGAHRSRVEAALHSLGG